MKNNYLIFIAMGIGGYLYYVNTPGYKKNWLLHHFSGQTTVFSSMSDAEISDSYNYVKHYMSQKQVPQSDPLYSRLIAIQTKYQIFLP